VKPDNRRKANAGRKAAAALACLACLLAAVAGAQNLRDPSGTEPEAEFHLGRVMYRTLGGGGSRGFSNPWWAIDYPVAEKNFLPALVRLTRLAVAEDSRHLELTDGRIFSYPFLFLQQPGNGNWQPSDEEARRLREYLMRGGFLLVDDFHGEFEWHILQTALRRVLPGREIVEIPDGDSVMHALYDLDERFQIPGRRHLRLRRGGEPVVYMQGPPSWRGIYDDHGRLLVAMNWNIDMGDGWEHADDPYYPVEMTGMAYRLAVNYVIYAMTH
jgi:hypothetical protein